MKGLANAARAKDVVRGLLALLALSMVLAGIPAALWIVGGSPTPTEWPGVVDVWEVVSRPDDGAFFLDVLILSGWVGWATFAISVLVEAFAAARGIVSPKIPGLATQQRLVAGLIAAVAAMASTHMAAAAANPARAAEQGEEMRGRDEWSPAPPVTNDLLNGAAGQPSTGGESTPSHMQAPPSEGRRTYEVRAGDTLWEIAEETLGSPKRLHDIYDASTPVRQPDGRRLSDPDLIMPGWTLVLPPLRGQEESRVEEPVVPDTGGPFAGAGNDALLPDTGGLSISEMGLGFPSADPSKLPGRDIGHLSEGDVGDVTRSAGDVGSVLAAGLVTVLVARRALRQRRRRPGQRPVVDAPADRALETRLRHAASDTVNYVDRALRTLGSAAAERGQPLPPLLAAKWTGTSLELDLAASAERLPPFKAVGSRCWVLAANAGDVLDSAAASRHPQPYPSLVTVGHDDDGALHLVNLAQLGVLTIDGGRAAALAMLVAMAAELATSPLADDVAVTLIGDAAGDSLDLLETGRLRRVDDVEQLIDHWTALVGAGAKRSADACASGPNQHVILTAVPLSVQQQQRLEALVQQTPHRVAGVFVGPHGTSPWTLRFADSSPYSKAVLDPLGLRIRPQLLDLATLQRLASLLRNAGLVTEDRSRSSSFPLSVRASDTATDPGERRGAGGMWQPAATPGEFDPRPTGLVDGSTSATATLLDPATRQEGPTRVDAGPAPSSVRAGLHLPRLLMLGPVEVANAVELAEPNKLGQLTELAMFIALNPGCDTHAIDEAIWPGSLVTRTTRNTATSKLRRWLGVDDEGSLLLPKTEGRYVFSSLLRSDWQDWHDLLRDGPESASTAALSSALALVRGRPLSGRGRRPYAWADHHQQEMISAVIDACHELASRRLASRRPREAMNPILLGLSIEPAAELLWRDRLEAEALFGGRSVLTASVTRLRQLVEELGGGLEPETEEAIEQAMKAADTR